MTAALVEIAGESYRLRPAPGGAVVTHAGGWRPAYALTALAGGRWRCSCPGFFYRKTCKHAQKMEEVSVTTQTKERPAANDRAAGATGGEIVPAAPPQALVIPPPGARPAPVGATACPGLAKALAAARDRCKAAAKDARNDFHKYDYASADNVIAVATEALEGSGLALIPAREELVAVGSTYALNRLLFLAHASGEFVPLETLGWPVVPDKGRPLDKAFAVALTSSLAYKLRDLLQIPRGTEDDMSARDDREAQAPPPPPAPAAARGPSVYDKVCDVERRLSDKGLCRPGDLVRVLKDRLGGRWGRDAEAWPAESWAEVKAACAADARRRHQDRLADELQRTGRTWAWCREKLGEGAPEAPADLTGEQWQACMESLGELEKVAG